MMQLNQRKLLTSILKKDIKSDDVSTLIGKEPLPTETKRYWDIVRKASINGDYMIIGVEHQVV